MKNWLGVGIVLGMLLALAGSTLYRHVGGDNYVIVETRYANLLARRTAFSGIDPGSVRLIAIKATDNTMGALPAVATTTAIPRAAAEKLLQTGKGLAKELEKAQKAQAQGKGKAS